MRIKYRAIIGLLLWLIAAAPCPSQQPQLQTAVNQEEPRVAVFYLKHLKVLDAADMVGKLMRDHQLNITADQRLNALIASGPEDAMKMLETILLRLDTPAPADDPKVSILDSSFDPVTAQGILKALRLDVAIAPTAEGLIIASEDQQALQQAEATIRAITQSQRSSAETYSIQVYWVTEDQEIEGTSKFEDLVANKLADRGIQNLSIVSQLALTSQVGQECFASGPAVGGSLTCDGQLEESASGLSLQLKLTAIRSETPTELQSNMILRPGQWMVFGIVQSPSGQGTKNRDLFLIRVDTLKPL